MLPISALGQRTLYLSGLHVRGVMWHGESRHVLAMSDTKVALCTVAPDI